MEEKIGIALKTRLQSVKDFETLDVNIFLKDEPASDTLAAIDWASEVAEDSERRVSTIKDAAGASQSNLVSYLQGLEGEAFFLSDNLSVRKAAVKQSFWINNSLGAEVTPDILDSVLNRPDVVFVELSRHVDFKELLDDVSTLSETPATPADATSQPTWSVKRVNAPLLWQQNLQGQGVLVAVVDSGVNYGHPDLKSHMWDGAGEGYPNHGYDFMNQDMDPRDNDGHGTACAGIVAGDGTAGSSTGVAPKATIMALRAGNTERSIWDALEFAIEHKAKVISMSMSWKYPRQPDYPGWRRTCETILAAGVLHANSIGNQGDQLGGYPIPYNIAAPGNCPPPKTHPLQLISGGLSSAIACGATDDTDALADYSGRGPAAWEAAPYTDYPYQAGAKQGLMKPDVCAPGPGTTSCNWEYSEGGGAQPYMGFGGTSAATPHVAGCLALLAQASGGSINPVRIQEALENTAVKISGQTKEKENHYGAGRVDVFAAYQYGKSKGWW